MERFAERVSGRGRVCDLGCGPGQVARYLADCGVDGVFGVDLSPAMLDQARRLNPDLSFHVDDMRALSIEDGTLAGIAAFYSIIHIPREQIPAVLSEQFLRVLQPDGWLMMEFHLGDEVIHLEEWWGHEVDFAFYGLEEMVAWVEAAGFRVEEARVREPYADVEHPSQRGYLLAQKPVCDAGDSS